MIKTFRTAFSAFAAVCLVSSALAGCSQTARAPGQYGGTTGVRQNYGTNYGTNYAGTTVPGTRYGSNVGYNGYTSMNRPGYNGTNASLGNQLGIGNYTGYGMTGNRTTGYGTTGYGTNTNMGYTGYGTNTGTGFGTTGMNGTGLNTNTGTSPRTAGTNVNALKSAALRKQVLATTGVRAAEVLVVGDTALVGIKTTGTVSPSKVKAAVSRKVKAADTSIRRVKVSDATDILYRIRRLSTNLTGTTANNFTTEFNNLVGLGR